MRVLLRTDVNDLGRKGDIVEVADGYARNKLLPSRSALAATEKMTKQAEAMRRARDLKEARDMESAQSIRTILEEATIKVYAKAGPEGRLFGSVTAADVSDSVRIQTGVEVDRKSVHIAAPIKSLGVHVVTLNLYPGVDSEVTLEVMAEE
ncbi:MAG: 50S ribosomal protein L9 [Actinobacteria bacterium]|jgi:large subunit ribosomal protein L9|nr:50S ribosomal protein L9 [Actinomycetota bacterium]